MIQEVGLWVLTQSDFSIEALSQALVHPVRCTREWQRCWLAVSPDLATCLVQLILVVA